MSAPRTAFNRPPAGRDVGRRAGGVRGRLAGRGSAIFLHVNGAGSTAGCVSLARGNMIAVLRWLDPALAPRIVMGPLDAIGQA